MKRYIHQIKNISLILITILALSSCKENVFQAEEFKSGLYFINDSTDYSFGITPLEVESHIFELPVQIMGAPISQDRAFKVKVIAENTTAIENVHYEIPAILTIKADSVKGSLLLNILRNDLLNDSFKLTLSIVETEDFVPVSASMSKTIITFNNRVEQPNWLAKKSWNSDEMIKTWPRSRLGNWNPLTYVKFMELFAAMESQVPDTYNGMIKTYGGPLLPNFPGDWAWNYDFTLSKYVLIPMYRYFMVENPELGVVIPRPNGFN